MKSLERKVIGLVMMALIVIMPISSANVLGGTLTITKNSGQAGLDGFVNANDDTWTVEAAISNLQAGETVAPENVQIKVGNNKKNFNSCSLTDAGAVCQYLEPLTGGITPGAYTFNILYAPSSGAPDQKTSIISADGAAPSITFSQGSVKQEGEKVKLSFTVNDNAAPPCVGLSKVSVLDADSSAVLLVKDDFPEKSCNSYVFAEDSVFNGYLPAALDGEGVRRLKIIAEDRFGHSATSNVVSFLTDFVKPEVTNFNFTAFGKFIGVSEQVSSVTVNIKEKSNLAVQTVLATAAHTTLDKTPANSCQRTKNDPNVWECSWNNVKIDPTPSLSVMFSVSDAIGNNIETTLTQNFVTDTDAPVIEYFGPLLEYNGVGYVKSGQNPIVAKIREQGSGLNQANILAHLGSLGGIQSPSECNQEGDLFICYWYPNAQTITSTSGDVRISLIKVVDNVGNSASLPERDLIVDTASPLVEKVSLFGVSDGGAKNYFQSGDMIRVSVTIKEANGLFWMIDLRNVVNDAETQFPATKINGAGWQTFKGEEVCTENEEKSWDCTFETTPIKSGLLKNAFVVIQVRDAAGNLGTNWPDAANTEKRSGKNDEGKYAFDILAVKEEENPDYWSAGTAKPLLDFVDLDAMKFPTRIPITLSLKTDNLDARALNIGLIGCSPKQDANATVTAFPEISRSVIYGNVYPDGTSEPKPTVMLEFTPLSDVRTFFGIQQDGSFSGVNIPYTCEVKIYSRLGNTALANAETQEVEVSVPFAFSSLGSIDENLAQKVKALKETDFMKFANALEYLNTAIQWINYIFNFINIVHDFMVLWDVFTATQLGFASTAENTGILAQVGAALRGVCLTSEIAKKPVWTVIEYLHIIAQVFNCTPDPSNLGWYGGWQKVVLGTYNLATGRDVLGVPASSLYDNMYLSVAGLCVPGIVYNVHKAREIQCRQIVCYAKEVPAGIATYDSCDKLYDLQMCEFWAGPAFDIILLGAVSDLGKILKNAFGSPLGVIKVVDIAACAALCFTDKTGAGGLYYACKTTTALDKILNIINTIAQSIEQRPDIQGSPYCDLADSIDVNQLTGQVPS
ncbi:hypothetical protein HYT55_05535 [Candidatus Woesearchaeota archaeon]|nr:hypothetical protein [Candidatus Woesearchaeota archaeon]